MDEVTKFLTGFGPLGGTLFVCYLFAKFVTESRNAQFAAQQQQTTTFEKLSERMYENTIAVNRLADAVDDFRDDRAKGPTG